MFKAMVDVVIGDFADPLPLLHCSNGLEITAIQKTVHFGHRFCEYKLR